MSVFRFLFVTERGRREKEEPQKLGRSTAWLAVRGKEKKEGGPACLLMGTKKKGWACARIYPSTAKKKREGEKKRGKGPPPWAPRKGKEKGGVHEPCPIPSLNEEKAEGKRGGESAPFSSSAVRSPTTEREKGKEKSLRVPSALLHSNSIEKRRN